MSRQVLRTEKFVEDATAFIFELAQKALAERNEFRIALSGGNTPRPVYAQLGRIAHDFPWDKTLITFGDERCVPPDHEQSNYRMARESLLVPGNIPDKSVLRMRGEIDPQVAGCEYEEQLDALATKREEQVYRHDLILLGLGEDGHTASLFPGTPALEETTRRVMANFVPKFNSWRLTFTFPLINQARQVCFLVNATKHAELIERVLQRDPELPASRVQPISGDLTWILGQAA
jgi:6-phosphogluconolactonase